VTGVGARPVLLRDDPEAALDEVEIFGDRFASAEYRRELAAVVVRRASESAAERAGEDS
jgi:CO/xanthine dehydrogenase FAD-binding subunit